MESTTLFEKGIFDIKIDTKAQKISLKEYWSYNLEKYEEIGISFNEEPLYRLSFLMDYKRAAIFFKTTFEEGKDINIEEIKNFSFPEENNSTLENISSYYAFKAIFSTEQFKTLKAKAKEYFTDYTLLPIIDANLNSELQGGNFIKITSNEGFPTLFGKILEALPGGLVTLITDVDDYIELHSKTPYQQVALDNIPTARLYLLDEFFEKERARLIKGKQKFLDKQATLIAKMEKEAQKTKEKAEREQASISRQNEDLQGQIEELRIKAENKLEKEDYRAIKAMITTFKKENKEISKEANDKLQEFLSKLKIEYNLKKKVEINN